MDFIFPDFNKSILNITASIASYLGCENKNKTLNIIDEELKKNYKNIVFMCIDGLGINPININLDEDSFLRKNIKMNLTSTFPSTTTNATNSLLTNKYPLEHGWFGWSLNFPNLNRNIDIFLKRDSESREELKIEDAPIKIEDYYFDKANSVYEIHSIFPKYVEVKNQKNNHVYETVDDFFNNLKLVLKNNNKKFIYSYLFEPDSLMHDYGVSSVEAKKLINYINDKIEELYKISNDTLFIITADHGQIDVKGYVDFYHDEKLMSMLKIYPYLDARAVAFKLKDDINHNDFINYFNDNYKDDFILYKSKDLIDMNVFGPIGDKGYLLGDFIAIGTYTHKIGWLTPNQHKFLGHHTSLTEEMLVPLIMVNK